MHVKRLPSPPPAQFAALVVSNGRARFKHFVATAADRETVWGMRNADGWIALAGDDGARGIALWPHPDYATAWAANEWPGYAPAAIDVHALTHQWLATMAEQQVSVAVFPSRVTGCVWKSASELQRALLEELDRY